MIRLIKCTPEDVEALQNISIETFSATFGPYNTEANLKGYLKKAYNIKTLKQELSNPNSEFYFAYEDSKIAGYLKINILDAQSEKWPMIFWKFNESMSERILNVTALAKKCWNLLLKEPVI